MKERKRTVITTDGEVDDMNSFIRYLLYANELINEGLVLTSSVYHYAGDPEKGIEPYRWTGEDWVYRVIDNYEKVYENLKLHDEGFPEPNFFRQNYYVGNISYKGEMEQVTEGSEFLKQLFLDENDETLYVQTWGGTNTTARALKSIEEAYSNDADWAKIKQKVEEKLVIIIILDQDETYSEYIAKHWNIEVINDQSNFWHFAYFWKAEEESLTEKLGGEWYKKNIREGHGPLLEDYALMGDGRMIDGELFDEQRGAKEFLENHPEYQPYDFISEGDSPSFFHLFNNGLRSYEQPTFGGWGGRFIQQEKKFADNGVLDFNPYTARYEASYSLMRWMDDIQNDFAVRADWCVTSDFSQTVHYPEVEALTELDLAVTPGEKVELPVKAYDVNGHGVRYQWWHYHEASSYSDNQLLEKKMTFNKDDDAMGYVADFDPAVYKVVKIEKANTAIPIIHVPKDLETGQTLHIILEVTSDAATTLKTYRRFILTGK